MNSLSDQEGRNSKAKGVAVIMEWSQTSTGVSSISLLF